LKEEKADPSRRGGLGMTRRREWRFDRTLEPSGEPDVGEVEVPRAREREIPRFARDDGTMAGGAYHGG